MVAVKFTKTHEAAQMPKRNHGNMTRYDMCRNGHIPVTGTGDTGYDTFAVEKVVIPAKGSAIVLSC